MRHIKKSDLRARVKDAWITAAAEGLKELRKKTTHDERSKFITKFFQDNATLWTELKQCMAQPVPAKCWYSEVQRGLPDLEIDHFRPKNAVSGCKHEGYWWLAFDWENFRISSPMANKRRKDLRAGTVDGKGTQFPLCDESKRVSDDLTASMRNEKPLLLDPFEAGDIMLLDYEVESGKAVEKYGEKENGLKHLRAKKSIELYHLNEGTIITQRAERGVALTAKAERIEELFSGEEAGEQLSDKEAEELNKLQNEVAGYVNATAEYSAFFRALLKQRGNRGWNEELLAIT
jgi:hypothetical protein